MSSSKQRGPLTDRDQISGFVGTLVLGLALVRFVDLPTREVGTQALGSAIGIQLSTPVVMLLVLGVLAATGMDSLLRSHPTARARPQAGAFVLWVLPVFTVLALELGLMRLPADQLLLWGLGLAGSGIVVALVMTAEYISLDREHPLYTPVQLALTGLTYILGLVLFTAIYATKGRALLTATLSTVVAAALALRLFWLQARQTGRALLYAAVTGVGLGQCVWALGYGRPTPLAAGLLLLLILYTGAGLSQTALQRAFGRRTLIEFGVVAALGLAIIFRYVI